MTSDTTLSADPAQDLGRPGVEVAGPRFRVRTPKFATQGLPETPSNRHLTVVWGRWLVDEHGKPGCTWQALAAMVGSANRQAASQQLEDLRQCGEDFRAFMRRQRKVEATVVDAVLAARLQTPGAGPTEVVPRVHAPLGRQALTVATIECAFEQLACVPVRRTLRRQLAAGHVRSQEADLLTASLASRSPPPGPSAHWGLPGADRGMQLTDPTALAALVTPELPLERVRDSLCWLTFLLTLFDWHGPVSVWGRWCGVHQTTIGRWVLGLALAWWPLIDRWIGERVQAPMVDVDEQWLKIRGRWPYGFVVWDVDTELPVLAALLPSRGPWACRGVGRQLRRRNKVPQVLITDGLQAYAYLVPGATHVLCRVHHQQGVTPWGPQHLATEVESHARKPAMKRVLQTRDTRPVRRRLARWRARAPAGGMTTWVQGIEEKLPQLICRGGRVRLPSTTNAVERCFRAFQRLYRTRGGFHSVLSAKRELLLFWVVYVFTQHATTGHAPIEVVMPEARSMPLYRLINDPFRALREREYVKATAPMADVLPPQEAAT